MELIECGKIINTQGIKGDLKTHVWSNSPYDLMQFNEFYIGDKKEKYHLVDSRESKGFLYIKLEGIDSIEQAKLFVNKIVYADKSCFKLDDGVFFIQDLIGLDVFDADNNTHYGQIKQVLQNGANDVYVISDGTTERLLPAIKDCIISTDINKKTMIIRPLKGLFE